MKVKDFADFLNVSPGSVAETKSHLYPVFDLDYIAQNIFDEMYQKLDEVGRTLFALSNRLRQD